jgi:SAM-dependent methyltransferase
MLPADPQKTCEPMRHADGDAAGFLIDAVSHYLAMLGVDEGDQTLIERAAQDVARLLSVTWRGRLQTAAPSQRAVSVQPSVGSDYEGGWDAYSQRWDTSVWREGLQYLGDEWGVPELTNAVIDQYVRPYLSVDATVLEIGCGGGKYSEKLAPLCRSLICGDVSSQMLQRTKERLEGFGNVQFAKLNGVDLRRFDSDSVDFVFSFDCFVHIDMEDVYCYLQEIRRVLRPNGVGLLHFANLNSEEGWQKFVVEAPINRGPHKHFDRFRFLTWEIVARFLDALNLGLLAHKREPWRDILVVFEKRVGDRLE